MKVDQYRLQKHKEYSFLVPTGMDLGDFDEPQKGWIEIYLPFALEQHDVELETLVAGSELARAIEDLRNDNLAMLLAVDVIPPDAVAEDGID